MSQQIVMCSNGIFTLPEQVVTSLRNAAPGGIIFVRQDEDLFTISAARMDGGRRKQLAPQVHAAMFRNATRLVVIDLVEAFGIFAAEWRPPRRVRTATTET